MRSWFQPTSRLPGAPGRQTRKSTPGCKPPPRAMWKHGGMGSFILRVIVNAAALWVASWVLPGMDISSTATSDAVARSGISQDTGIIGIVLAYLFIGLIFGVVNAFVRPLVRLLALDRKSTRLNSSHDQISYAVFCLKK